MLKNALVAFALSTGAAMAHTGHAEAAAHGDAHWLTTGDHIIVLALTAILFGNLARRALRARKSDQQKA